MIDAATVVAFDYEAAMIQYTPNGDKIPFFFVNLCVPRVFVVKNFTTKAQREKRQFHAVLSITSFIAS